MSRGWKPVGCFARLDTLPSSANFFIGIRTTPILISNGVEYETIYPSFHLRSSNHLFELANAGFRSSAAGQVGDDPRKNRDRRGPVAQRRDQGRRSHGATAGG